jgi:hypothetical protein
VEIATLTKLYSVEGPFVTIYLGTPSDVPNAEQQHELRWRNLLRDLEERGVDQRTRNALDAAVGGHEPGGQRVLVAARGQVLLATNLPEEPAQEVTVSVGPLPALLPLVESLTLRVPHLVVLADRIGADIFAYAGSDEPVESAEVTGEEWPIRKVAAGGWSQRRYQARAEENWEHNAKSVAATVARVAADVNARLVVAAGDVRALTLIADDLPENVKPLWTTVEGGRGADGSETLVAERVLDKVGELLRSETLTLLETFAQERGQGDRACDGAADTIAALRMAQVDTLLVTDQLDPARTAQFGPLPTQLGLTTDELDAMGVDRPQQGPLVDVLLRAALATDAAARLVPGDLESSPREGVGALLRFATPGSGG